MNEQNDSLAPRRGRPPLNRETSPSPEVMVTSLVVEPARRVTRRPFSSISQKLAYAEREGFHRHWFNETGSRIQQALEAGYEHVKDRDGKNVSRIVGVAEGGGALHAFLMEVRMEWYLEDMAREQQLINDREASIKKGATQGAEVEKGYVPSQGISIR